MKPKIVQGLVADEADAPIPDALIELDCRQKEKQITAASTKSRIDGRFEIKAILRGVCKIRISHTGFSGVVIPISDPTGAPWPILEKPDSVSVAQDRELSATK